MNQPDNDKTADAAQNRGIDWFALALSVVALVGMLRWKWSVIAVVAGSGALGLAYRLLLGS